MIKIDIPKIETKLQVNNEANSDIAEMYLYGTIRQGYWWDEEEDCISAKRVKNAIKDLKGKDINVHINSSGGDVFESIAICNLFKQHDGNINVIIDALAASGASVIAMSGAKILMPKNSMMMIHKAWTFTDGNSDELRKTASDLDKMDSAVLESYKSRFIGTEEELKALIKESSWLTAEECKALGLCDEIIEGKQEEPKGNIKNSILNKYMNDAKGPEDIENNNKQIMQNILKTLGGIN